MKINEVKYLIDKYGDITLHQLLEKVQGKRIYECTKCHGLGRVEVENEDYYRASYNGEWCLPNKTKIEPCTLCDSTGYTEQEY